MNKYTNVRTYSCMKKVGKQKNYKYFPYMLIRIFNINVDFK